MQSTQQTSYLPSLDGWRAIAILIVVLYHGSDAIRVALGHPAIGVQGPLVMWGDFGVEIFFALSGLLITSRMLDEEQKTGSMDLYTFYVRRVFRILPASLTFLLVVFVLGRLGLVEFKLGAWLGALLFFINFMPASQVVWSVGHFWSLSVEEHFYAFWPAAFKFLRPKTRLLAAIAAVFALTIWRLINVKFSGQAIAFHIRYFDHQGRTDFRLDGIVFGAIAALLVKKYPERMRRALSIRTGAILLLIAVSTMTLHVNWRIVQMLIIYRKAAVPLVLVSTVLHCEGAVKTFFEDARLRWLGKISYSLYLWQQIFLVLIPGATSYPLLRQFPINFACALVCAIGSHYLIEKPLIRIGHRLDPPSQPLASVQTSRPFASG